jgi:glutamate/aspartate transport system substrate-binding protein
MTRFAMLLMAVLAGIPPAAAQSAALERIRQSGVITMGYIEDGVPFSFSFAGTERQPQGFAVDLCREVALGIRAHLRLERIETRWVPLTIQNRLEAVRSGRVDIECSTTTWTLSRQATVDFSLITFVDGGSILSRSGSKLVRLLDFDGKRVAAITGTTTENALRDSLSQRSMKTELVPIKTRIEGLKLLDEGKVDGFASDRTTLIGIVATQPTTGRFTLLEEDFSVEPYALALPRDDHEFRLAVNRVLARIYRSGEIVRIYNRWLGDLGPPSLLLSATYFVQGLGE